MTLQPWLDWFSFRRRRLASYQCSFDVELDTLRDRVTPPADPSSSKTTDRKVETTDVKAQTTDLEAIRAVRDARRLLDCSRTKLRNGDVDGGWHTLHAAKRAAIGARTDEEHELIIELLPIEAEKVKKWRKTAVERALKKAGNTRPSRVAALREAAWLRDEDYENGYYRLAMLLRQLIGIGAIALGAVTAAAMIILTSRGPIADLQPWSRRLTLLVILFGLMGATVSAFRSTVVSWRQNIPDTLSSGWVTTARIVLAACTSLAMYAFFTAKVPDLGAVNALRALAIAFSSGFSERLISKSVEHFAGKDGTS